MFKPHLITTSAHLDNQNRILEYIDGYKLIAGLKENFESITIIETISQIKLDYLEDSGLTVYYSKLGNPNLNKGVNWLNHVTSFLSQSTIKDDEIVIFITGRYKLINTNILTLIKTHMLDEKIDFMAKDDSDLYVGDIHGVHTFFMAFTKKKFLDFSNWYQTKGQTNDCIEWDVKKYLEKHNNTLILSKDTIMGVETRVFNSKLNKIC
jgi:hypothetical protein